MLLLGSTSTIQISMRMENRNYGVKCTFFNTTVSRMRAEVFWVPKTGRKKFCQCRKLCTVIVINTRSVYKLSLDKFEKRSTIPIYNRDFGRLREEIFFVLTKRQK